MKEILKCFFYAIIFISPLILVVFLIYEFINFNYVVPVNDNNTKIVNRYLEMNNIEVKGNIKKIKLNDSIFSFNLNIIYETGKTQETSFERLDFEDNPLCIYIIKSNVNHILSIISTLLIISIISNIFAIGNFKKTKKIIEEDI